METQEKRVRQAMRSLDDSIPISIRHQQGDLDRPGLRDCLHDMCQIVGIDWTEQFGDFLLARVLERFDVAHKGSISYQELLAVVNMMKQVPRGLTRHPKHCVVLGGGAFGTAMACVLARKGHAVTLCFRQEEEKIAQGVNRNHINTMCFPGTKLHERIRATTNTTEALVSSVDLLVHCIPVQFSLSYLKQLREHIPAGVPIVSTSKGIHLDTRQFMNAIFKEALKPHTTSNPLLFLSGPSFASGLVHGDPTIATLASTDADAAQYVQGVLSTPDFRVYTTTDVVGVEVAGALKNVLAIASGMALGLGFGPNTQASLITRGWQEIRTIATALGGKTITMVGLGGLGDLMMTCYSRESRNVRFGELVAQGNSVHEAMEAVGQVVEGFKTCSAAVQLAAREDVDVPVLDAIYGVLHGEITPRDMVIYIMSLPLTEEFVESEE